MRAIVLRRYGGPASCALEDVPEPLPGPTDLLVDVRAASVNPVDFKIREGEVKRVLRGIRPPIVMGNDLAGVVRAAGKQVMRFRPGDRVFARVGKERLGAFAERALVDEGHAARMPESLSFEEAASIPLVALTAWQAFVEVAKVQPGQLALVHAGAGGLGTVAIQVAKHLGLEVATTASAKNHDLVRSLGADIAIDYKAQRFEEVVRDADVVLDSLGMPGTLASIDAAKPGGIIVDVTGPPDQAFADERGLGFVARAALGFLGRKRTKKLAAKGVRYKFLFMRPDGVQLETIAGLLREKRVRPVLDTMYPLEKGLEALAHVEGGRARGKVVIQVSAG